MESHLERISFYVKKCVLVSLDSVPFWPDLAEYEKATVIRGFLEDTGSSGSFFGIFLGFSRKWENNWLALLPSRATIFWWKLGSQQPLARASNVSREWPHSGTFILYFKILCNERIKVTSGNWSCYCGIKCCCDLTMVDHWGAHPTKMFSLLTVFFRGDKAKYCFGISFRGLAPLPQEVL